MASVTNVRAAAASGGLARSSLAWARQSQAWLLVAVLVVGSLVVQPSVIVGANGQELLRQLAILGLLSVGQSAVIIGGGIDLSVAANVRISSVVGATYFATPDASLLVGILLTILVSMAIGLVNGILIGPLGLPPFITTFAVLLVLDGVTLTLASSAVGAAPERLILAYTQSIWFVPLPAVVLIATALVAWYAMRSTVWGKSVYAMGGDPVLAGHAGVRVIRTRVSMYVDSGFTAGLTSIVLLSRSGVGDPTAIPGMELMAVTAVAIGGVSLAGGKGSVIGALGGATFLILVSVLLSQAGVPDRYLVLAQGVIILLALASYRQRRRDRRQ